VIERKDIDTLKNAIVLGGDSLRAVTKTRFWNPEHEVFTHIFYNPVKAATSREKIYAMVAEMRRKAFLDPEKYTDNAEFAKYMIIRKSSASGYTVNIREKAVGDEFKHSGWLVIISNHIEDAEETLRIYRSKDVVEKGFLRLKNSLDLGRLRVHGDEAMQNKIFIGFIALVLLAQIHNTMLDKNLYKKHTMKQLMRTLSKHRVQEINGTRILYAATKQQNDIYTAFGVKTVL